VELHAKNYEKKHHNKTSKVAMDFGKAMYNDHGILVSKEATLGEKALLESKK
jgi:hypothetical protein